MQACHEDELVTIGHNCYDQVQKSKELVLKDILDICTNETKHQ